MPVQTNRFSQRRGNVLRFTGRPPPGVAALIVERLSEWTRSDTINKWLRIVLAGLLVVMLSGLGWVVLCPQESDPILDGKPLTAWLDNYVAGNR